MMAVKESEKRVFKRWRGDPLAFVQDAILAPYNAAKGATYSVSHQQQEALEAMGKLVQAKEAGQARDTLGISIMSGKGTGKDATASWIILWFLSCFSYPKIPCVSVSDDQLKKVLWSELSKWLMYSPLKHSFSLQNDKLFCTTVPSEARGKRWMAFPKAANPKQSHDEQVETLAGIHEEHLLQVVDEGSGVLEPVFDVLEGNMTGRINLMLLIFNPTRSKGYAIDTQYKHGVRWIPLRWNAEESELVERSHIERLEQDYGRDSNTYRVKVLGLPPVADEQTLIPWDWLQDAVERPLEPLPTDPLVKAADCGAGGDKSVIATRKGGVVYPFKRNNSADSVVVANWIGQDVDAERPDVLRVDTLGIGWAIEGMLREKKGGIIEAADVRRMADDPERFFNKRAEMYWRLREQYERGAISTPNDADLLDQLGATKCEYLKSKLKIIEKKRIKQEIGHSPDEADALALTYFYPDSMTSRTTRPGRVRERMSMRSATAWMGA